MSACEHYEADISALLDGELDAGEEKALRAHMETCPDCRALYETFSLLHADAQEPPADLTMRIMGAVREEAQGNIIPIPKKKNRWVPWLAAAACFVVILGAVTLPHLSGTHAPAAEDAATRTIPAAENAASESVESDAAPEDTADSDASEDLMQSDGSFATSAEALTISDGAQIADVRALLTGPTETEAPESGAMPVLVLSEDGADLTVYLDGDDVIYTTDGAQYFRCENAADALIDYLAQI